ncbi:MAG: MarR family transcriptional regulator [Candidatus Eremiobacteraeota bacterium]|nr:MarR family transcriptional regulator [Candidatus Eremiobacteraeota bacterium]
MEVEFAQRVNPLGNLAVEIFRLNGALLSSGNSMTRDLGMSSSRWQVVGAIEMAGRPLSVSQIARNMGLTRQSVQRLVNELEADGFLVLADNPNHRRASLASLTPTGRRVFRKIMDRQVTWSEQILAAAALSERRIGEVTSVLRRLREAFEGK